MTVALDREFYHNDNDIYDNIQYDLLLVYQLIARQGRKWINFSAKHLQVMEIILDKIFVKHDVNKYWKTVILAKSLTTACFVKKNIDLRLTAFSHLPASRAVEKLFSAWILSLILWLTSAKSVCSLAEEWKTDLTPYWCVMNQNNNEDDYFLVKALNINVVQTGKRSKRMTT